ncbi:hypothetical protein [Aurantiacibacter marinus]|nr:hypothetical protein [Aurantiacibacter marinus]
MVKAVALTHAITPQLRETARTLIVAFCGMSLIAAGQFLPI